MIAVVVIFIAVVRITIFIITTSRLGKTLCRELGVNTAGYRAELG